MAYASIGGFAAPQGLWSGVVPTIIGSVFARTVLMVTTLTSAIALSAGSVLADAGLRPDDTGALATLAILTGLIMLVLGLLKLGSVMAYVSAAVMTGFTTGIALQIITGVLKDATGYTTSASNTLAKLIDTPSPQASASPYPNPDGSRPNASRDFTAQGLANIAGRFFSALPTGGSFVTHRGRHQRRGPHAVVRDLRRHLLRGRERRSRAPCAGAGRIPSATLIKSMENAADRLRRQGILLVLSGVDERLYEQLVRTRAIDALADENVLRTTTSVVLESLTAAYELAKGAARTSNEGSPP
jgi:hypothetical protein